jgi:hypothetical protein
VFKILIEKPEWKRLLRRLRHRWEDNIKMGLLEIEWKGVDWLRIGTDGRDGKNGLMR